MDGIQLLFGADPIWARLMEWEGRGDLFRMTSEANMHSQALCRACVGFPRANSAVWRVFPVCRRGDASCPSWLDVLPRRADSRRLSPCRVPWGGKITCRGEPALPRVVLFIWRGF